MSYEMSCAEVFWSTWIGMADILIWAYVALQIATC